MAMGKSLGSLEGPKHFDLAQAQDFADAVANGLARPGTIHFLESPYTNEFGASPEVMKVLTRADFDFAYYTGPWWRNPPL